MTHPTFTQAFGSTSPEDAMTNAVGGEAEMVLVPRDPTQAMLQAMLLPGFDDPDHEASAVGHRWVRRAMYEAALDAAPFAAPASAGADWEALPLDIAKIIDGAFLPANPRKLRSASPETIEAAERFKKWIALAASSPVSQEPVAWLDKRTAGKCWEERLVATNPDYPAQNGPENFAPLYAHPALATPETPGREDALREAIKVAVNSCRDVTGLGRFSSTVDPVRWVAQLEMHLAAALAQPGPDARDEEGRDDA